MSLFSHSAVEWMPFFTPAYPNPGLPTVQIDLLPYIITPADTVLTLQVRTLEQKYVCRSYLQAVVFVGAH